MDKQDKRLVECPRCLGSKEVFNPIEDKLENCNFCKGEGKVSNDKSDLYDPVAYELGISSDTFLFDEDE